MAGSSELLIAKIDIEGSERELFRSNTDWMDTTALILIELHDWLQPWSMISHNFLRQLCDRGFDVLWRGETMFCFNHRLFD